MVTMGYQISLFSKNIKFLRERKGISHSDLEALLLLKPGKIESYESRFKLNPALDDLVKISDYFQMSIDLMLRDDLSKYSELKLKEIESRFDYARGHNLRIVAITLNDKGDENIEYVPVRVKAGYLSGYNDPEFIKELPKLRLPFLSNNRTMRMFDCEGESMLPLPSRCRIIGEYVEDWHDIRDGNLYIVISEKGYAVKKVFKRLENNSLTLKSFNPLYIDYEVYLKEVYEIWKFVSYMSDTIPEVPISSELLLSRMDEMKKMVLKGKL